MGRKGSLLVPFLQKGLNEKKYQNLTFEDESRLIFIINFRHKAKGLGEEDEKICKDWYELKDKEYVSGSNHYKLAKKSLLASLKTRIM
ncbi:hypothetical protein AVEN_228659-1 [Araneus ventricosus]|uniref:IRF tryptophan pentad repeat domain-containing protein n=1 Tax=Araneus ventricosus TaxID=182803 RepID=A0A4Y2P896_ARAVE|nr:hypothetical protein AVEN_228659-1 [Araneus ventricosus]